MLAVNARVIFKRINPTLSEEWKDVAQNQLTKLPAGCRDFFLPIECPPNERCKCNALIKATPVPSNYV
jgi:hypothetical protein